MSGEGSSSLQGLLQQKSQLERELREVRLPRPFCHVLLACRFFSTIVPDHVGTLQRTSSGRCMIWPFCMWRSLHRNSLTGSVACCTRLWPSR